jgi:hypothetical protein
MVSDGTVDNKVLYWEILDWEVVGNCTGLCTSSVSILMVSDLSFVVACVAEYSVIQNDCRGFNNLSYTMHLR